MLPQGLRADADLAESRRKRELVDRRDQPSVQPPAPAFVPARRRFVRDDLLDRDEAALAVQRCGAGRVDDETVAADYPRALREERRTAAVARHSRAAFIPALLRVGRLPGARNLDPPGHLTTTVRCKKCRACTSSGRSCSNALSSAESVS